MLVLKTAGIKEFLEQLSSHWLLRKGIWHSVVLLLYRLVRLLNVSVQPANRVKGDIAYLTAI